MKFVHPNWPQAGFEFRSLEPQVGILQIEPPLCVVVVACHKRNMLWVVARKIGPLSRVVCPPVLLF